MSEPRRRAEETRDELVRRYQRRIYGVIYRTTGHHSEVDDLCQETFLQIFRGIDRLRPDSNVDAWVYRVATNVAVDWLRRRGKDRAVKASLEREPPRASGPPSSDAELADAVRAAIAALPPDQRVVLVLRMFEGLSHEEIAAVQESSVATVRWRLFAARRKLEKLLGAYLK